MKKRDLDFLDVSFPENLRTDEKAKSPQTNTLLIGTRVSARWGDCEYRRRRALGR